MYHRKCGAEDYNCKKKKDLVGSTLHCEHDGWLVIMKVNDLTLHKYVQCPHEYKEEGFIAPDVEH